MQDKINVNRIAAVNVFYFDFVDDSPADVIIIADIPNDLVQFDRQSQNSLEC